VDVVLDDVAEVELNDEYIIVSGKLTLTSKEDDVGNGGFIRRRKRLSDASQI
jgi:hypothetical protein